MIMIMFHISLFVILGAAVAVPLSLEQAKLCMVNDLKDLSPLAIAYARARGNFLLNIFSLSMRIIFPQV